MVKINIQFEEPTEEWNQLIEIANTDKTILGYLLQREDVEVFLSKIDDVHEIRVRSLAICLFCTCIRVRISMSILMTNE